MNELRLRRLSLPALLLSTLATLTLGVACGGTSASDGPASAGASASGGEVAHAGGAAGGAGLNGDGGLGGSGVAGSGAASGSSGVAGTAGASGAGAGGAGGSSAGAGGAAGSGAAGSGAAAGTGGASGGGNAGTGQGGSSATCHATPPQVCAGGPITLPRSCVTEEMATVGTALPSNTCRTMCESPFASCTISAVQPTSITVQCVTGCPAG